MDALERVNGGGGGGGVGVRKKCPNCALRETMDL